MICPTCNAPNRDDAKFCKSCGQPLHVQLAPSSEVALHEYVPDITDIPVSTQEGDTSSDVKQELGEQQHEYTLSEEFDDANQEPTLILTPEKMLAYQSMHWQRQLEREGNYIPGSLEAGASKD